MNNIYFLVKLNNHSAAFILVLFSYALTCFLAVLYVALHTPLSVCLSCLSVVSLVCLSVCPSTCLCLLSLSLSVCLPVCLSVSLSLSLSHSLSLSISLSSEILCFPAVFSCDYKWKTPWMHFEITIGSHNPYILLSACSSQYKYSVKLDGYGLGLKARK